MRNYAPYIITLTDGILQLNRIIYFYITLDYLTEPWQNLYKRRVFLK